MLRDNPELPGDRRRTAYDAQARATERLMRLVESLLDFGRMEAGAREYRLAMHDCGALVTSVVEDFNNEVDPTGRPIRVETRGAVDARVDPEALGRAVRNLLDNALKYSPGRPSIDVTVSPRRAEVVITVTDHGIGIPAAELASVFAKFTRGEEARTRGIKGTGIGLAMVDEVVRAHHGRVEVASEPGRGSAFAIVLPAGRPAHAAAPAETGNRVRA
jgi:signal transduction histidine kinase